MRGTGGPATAVHGCAIGTGSAASPPASAIATASPAYRRASPGAIAWKRRAAITRAGDSHKVSGAVAPAAISASAAAGSSPGYQWKSPSLARGVGCFCNHS
jgi:hypothetical protein